MANSNSMARLDAAKNHVGAKMLVLDSVGDVGQIPLDGRVMAWANFNGTGAISIRASANVSSITDGGNGAYTVNFTTPMPDANFAVFSTASDDNVSSRYSYEAGTFGQYRSVNAVKVYTFSGYNTNAPADAQSVSVMVVR